jgi:hypothetical protein
MTFLRSAVSRVVKLFVTDWSQALGIVVILLVGFLAARRVSDPAVGFAIAGALGLHLGLRVVVEGRRRRRSLLPESLYKT